MNDYYTNVEKGPDKLLNSAWNVMRMLRAVIFLLLRNARVDSIIISKWYSRNATVDCVFVFSNIFVPWKTARTLIYFKLYLNYNYVFSRWAKIIALSFGLWRFYCLVLYARMWNTAENYCVPNNNLNLLVILSLITSINIIDYYSHG